MVDALDVLAAARPPLVPGRALDLACGRGRHAILAASRGWHVDAVDFSIPALSDLRRNATARGVNVRCLATDVTRWPMPTELYDLVIVVSFLDRSLLPAVRAAVAPGGALIYQTQRYDAEAPPSLRPEFCLRPGELETLCRDWTVVLRRDERTLHRGAPAIMAGIAARRPAAPH